MAGSLVQWLRDNLGIIDDASEVETLARSVQGSEGAVWERCRVVADAAAPPLS